MTVKTYKVLSASTVKPAASARLAAFELEQREKDLSNVTDEEIIERLRYRFSVLDSMTRAVKKGDVRAMIVSGPPGVGKSFGVEGVLGKHELMAEVANNEKLKKFEIIRGDISPPLLFTKLYEFSDNKSILVFDDCDSVLQDEDSLNMMKSALDSNNKRILSYYKDSRVLENAGCPNQFEFKGGAIFVTNLKFDMVRSKKMRSHLEAIESRCHYLDLTIDTDREKILRIKQIIGDGMLNRYNFSTEEVQELIDFIEKNQKRMRELSLRAVLKLADLKICMPEDWRGVSEITLMK